MEASRVSSTMHPSGRGAGRGSAGYLGAWLIVSWKLAKMFPKFLILSYKFIQICILLFNM